MYYLCTHLNDGCIAQLNRASHYGCEGYRFESCCGHCKTESNWVPFFFYIIISTQVMGNDSK